MKREALAKYLEGLDSGTYQYLDYIGNNGMVKLKTPELSLDEPSMINIARISRQNKLKCTRRAALVELEGYGIFGKRILEFWTAGEHTDKVDFILVNPEYKPSHRLLDALKQVLWPSYPKPRKQL